MQASECSTWQMFCNCAETSFYASIAHKFFAIIKARDKRSNKCKAIKKCLKRQTFKKLKISQAVKNIKSISSINESLHSPPRKKKKVTEVLCGNSLHWNKWMVYKRILCYPFLSILSLPDLRNIASS